MPFEDFENQPITWNDHEDIAMKLYERFGDAFDEGKIYRIRFTDHGNSEFPGYQGGIHRGAPGANPGEVGVRVAG